MFRRQPPAPERVIDLADTDDALRREVDPDPVIEAAAERLRAQLSELRAVDEWGRPVAWRQVARIALGPLVTTRVRDALTADTLAEALVLEEPTLQVSSPQLSVSPEREADWRSFFRSIDENDRLLGDQAGALPES